MKIELFQHLKNMGVSDVEMEYSIGSDGVELNIFKVDGETSLIMQNENYRDALEQSIDSAVFDKLNSVELPPDSACDNDLEAYGKISVNLCDSSVKTSTTIHYVASEGKKNITTKIEMPEEITFPIPKIFSITYFGSGDDGGVDEIIYDDNKSGKFKEFDEWMKSNSYIFIPDDADFNNAGSSGETRCEVSDSIIICTAKHDQNYDDDVEASIDIQLKDIETQIDLELEQTIRE